MTSRKKISSNRINARKSSGPRSAKGKQRSARNALRHGLAIPAGSIAELKAEIQLVAKSLAKAAGAAATHELCLKAAEAQIDILRIRKTRRRLLACRTTLTESDPLLSSLDRYERRAFSKRKRALRDLEHIQKM